MNKEDRDALIKRIMDVAKNPKSAQFSLSVLLKRGDQDDVLPLMDYLNSSESGQRHMARLTLSEFNIVEAFQPLVDQLMAFGNSISFKAENEYKEKHFYTEIIDICRSLRKYLLKGLSGSDELEKKLLTMYRVSDHDILRYEILKVLLLFPNSLNSIISGFKELPARLRAAFYESMVTLDHPQKLSVYQFGLQDAANIETVMTHIIEFSEGRQLLNEKILLLDERARLLALEKLIDKRYSEFEFTLLNLLEFTDVKTHRLAAQALKSCFSSNFPLEKLLDVLNQGQTPDIVSCCLELVDHFVLKNPEWACLKAIQIQKSIPVKTIILDYLLAKIKFRKILSREFCDQVIKDFFSYLDIYNPNFDDFYIAFLKVIAGLNFKHSSVIRTFKRQLLQFEAQNQNNITTKYRNKSNEILVNMTKVMNKLVEAENRLSIIEKLDDIPESELNEEFILRIMNAVQNAFYISDQLRDKLSGWVQKLMEINDLPWEYYRNLWELIGMYGVKEELVRFEPYLQTDKMKMIKATSKKALQTIKFRLGMESNSLLNMTSLYYIKKTISDYCLDKSWKMVQNDSIDQLQSIFSYHFPICIVNDAYLDENLEVILDFLSDKNTRLIIISADISKYSRFQVQLKAELLRVPFKAEDLDKILNS